MPDQVLWSERQGGIIVIDDNKMMRLHEALLHPLYLIKSLLGHYSIHES